MQTLFLNFTQKRTNIYKLVFSILNMKRVAILLAILLLFPLVSAEIIINDQPGEVYNLGDIITIPVTIKTATDLTGVFEMNLLCNGHENNFYKNGVSLLSGQEKRMESSLVLTSAVIGELTGNCKIKAIIGDEFLLTTDFKISKLILLNSTIESLEFNPGQNTLISGDAIKENGGDVNGYVDLSIVEGNSTLLEYLETINNGFFSINVTFPENLKAGAYLMKLQAYEKDISDEKTNTGFTDRNIVIKQVPTSLEIFFENADVEPGTNLMVKTILHDQTGEKIVESSSIIIKNGKGKILEHADIATDEFLEFPIAYNEPVSNWTILATSGDLTSGASFRIMKKEAVSIEIVNRTLTISNIGNVLYNKTALVKIGNNSLNIDVYLEVDDSQKYLLTAPDGEYSVEVITETGSIETSLVLTGKSVDVKKASGAVGSLVKYPLVWIFIIIILGFVAFFAFKRGYTKKFVGYISSKKPKKNTKGEIALAKDSFTKPGNKAELSLSIKGDKQNASVIGLHIKNLKDLQSKESNAKEVIQELVNSAEKEKAVTYDHGSSMFFILAPTKTRTFKNEKTALDISQKIKSTIDEYNKTAKHKISYGISLNNGTIIAKQEDTFKFMSMGTLMAHTRKIASIAHGEILLGEKIQEKLKEEVKTIRHEKGNIHVYSIKEIKDVEGNKKFVKSFLSRIEGKDAVGNKKPEE